MRKRTSSLLIAVLALASLGGATSIASAKHGADDPAGHVRHAHGADDVKAKHHAHHRAHHVRHSGADDGPNHR